MYELDDEKNLSLIPEIEIKIINTKNQPVYLYYNSSSSKTFIIKINSVDYIEVTNYITNGYIYLGHLNEGDEITIKTTLNYKPNDKYEYNKYGYITLFAAGYNATIFKELYDILYIRFIKVL